MIAAAGVAAALVMTRPVAQRVEREVVGPLVRVQIARRGLVPVTVQGFGEVRAAVRAKIVPQVSGRVREVHSGLHAGGHVRAGEPLVIIDPTDFELALRTAEAQLAEARVAVDDEAEELRLSRELQARGVATDREVTKARVAHEKAVAAAAGAQVAVERARVDLERTQVTLPFDAVIVEESVDPGQFLTSGQSVGEAYGTEAAEVTVPLEDRDLAWLDPVPLPLASGDQVDPERMPRAEVHAEFAGRRCVWEGRAVRTEGQVDPRSRMVRVVVRVERPFTFSESRPPLMPGAFVRVGIDGRQLQGVIALPRHALHEGDTVWVVEQGKLHIRKVEVVRRERERVLIASGVEEGEVLVVSALDVATEGMEVRSVEEDAKPPAAGEGGDGKG